MTNQITITQTKANEEETTVLEKVKITKIEISTPIFEEGNYIYIKFTFNNSVFMIKEVFGEYSITIEFYEGTNLIKSIYYEPSASPAFYTVTITDKEVEVKTIDEYQQITEFTLTKEIAGDIINITTFGTQYYSDTPLRATIYYEEYIPPPPPSPTPTKKMEFPWWSLIILLLLIAIATRKEETQK